MEQREGSRKEDERKDWTIYRKDCLKERKGNTDKEVMKKGKRRQEQREGKREQRKETNKQKEGWEKRGNILKKLKKGGTKQERQNKKRRMKNGTEETKSLSRVRERKDKGNER